MAPSRETTIAAVAAGTIVTGVIALGVYNRKRTQELAAAAGSSISATASAAATKTSTAFKSAQSACSSSANTVITSASATWDSLAKKLGLKRVKSFPIVTDDEDVAAVVDQTSKAAKKASKKVAHQLETAGVPVAVTAK